LGTNKDDWQHIVEAERLKEGGYSPVKDEVLEGGSIEEMK